MQLQQGVIMFNIKKKQPKKSLEQVTLVKADVNQIKEKFNFNAFMHELKTIDLENYGSWSTPVKAVSWVLIFGITTAASSFLFVKPLKEQITSTVDERTVLLDNYRTVKSKLVGAEMYQKQLTIIAQKFNEQLNQLPKESEIPGLVEDISRLGANSGLKLGNIELDEEQKKEVFIEQPISISATGDFHSFGRFVSSVATLPRIVTIESFSAYTESKTEKNENYVPQVLYTIKASTYRYLDVQEPKPAPVVTPEIPQPEAN